MKLQNRGNLARQYPGLAEDLGLTSDQTEQLFDLLSEHQIRSQEQTQPMWIADEAADPETLQARQQKMHEQYQELQKQNEREIAQQLGTDKLQAWKDYQSTMGARWQ